MQVHEVSRELAAMCTLGIDGDKGMVGSEDS